jgi:hypothetical protein
MSSGAVVPSNARQWSGRIRYNVFVMKTTSLGLLAFIALGGCAGQTVANGSVHKAPPVNAISVGKMSSPKAGTQTIPIQDVDVYKFSAQDAELYWAYDGEVVYVWGTIELEDDVASGAADMILEADDFGYGWLISTSRATLHGCSADLLA